MRVLMMVVLAAWAVSTSMAAAAPPPVAAFARLEAIQDVAISPNCARIALLGGPAGARSLNIATLDTAGAKTVPLGDIEAVSVRWVGNDHVIVRVGFWEKLAPRREYRFERNIVVTAEGEIGALLLSNDHASRYATSQPIMRVVHGETPAVYLMGLQMTIDRSHVDSRIVQKGDEQTFKWSLWRADPTTGHGRIVENGNFDSIFFEPDGQGEARVRFEVDPDTAKARVFGRARGERRWTETWREESGGEYLGYSDPEDAIYLVQDVVGGRQVVRQRLSDGATDGMGEPSPYDPSTIVDPYTGQVLALLSGGESFTAQYLDDHIGAVHRLLSRAMGGRPVGLVDWSQDRTRFVVRTQSNDAPPTWHLLDWSKKELSPLGSGFPELNDQPMGQTQWLTYRARDGLEIPAYLTLPPGAGTGEVPRPLVVLPHGGPAARDTDRFDYLTQFLATRGYAVLRPQFRGSRGFGQAFEDAGKGEWAGKMQTDLLDGVAHLAEAGQIDPERVCIVGASYGGYAALVGVTLHPEAFQCAAAIAPVTDLQMLQLNVVRRSGRESGFFVGFRDQLANASREQMAAASPVTHAAAATAPILLMHGDQDTVVLLDHSVLMKNALERAGKPVELVVFEGENHYFFRPQSRARMLEQLGSFLSTHLPVN
ncbi:MAG: S9 family peptidase [Phenylobacterium sp.]|uniref:alpha/beta hydrolase family protein n=1 Tax=Phenylobacterium sp. TaxID=1871053 RepID=UPI0025F5615E|nr:S9 family peptidase [Phenylobacterium sp.]MCG9916804.1 S9 family peptidase [Phenylobacterium sp.]